jgi:cytochrome c553
MTSMILLMLSSACSTFSPESEPVPTVDPLEIGDPARGQEIFETGADILGTPCRRCHESEVSDSPSLEGVAERATSRVPGMLAEDYLRESILDPSAYVVEGYDDHMEKMYSLLLSDEDVNDIVAYLLTK